MPTSSHYADRVKECLMIGAVGDAFGYAVEFKTIDAIRREHGAAGLLEPVLDFGKSHSSDDTQIFRTFRQAA